MLIMRKWWSISFFHSVPKKLRQQLLQQIWAIGSIEIWFGIWDDLASPKIGVTLEPKPLYYKNVVSNYKAESRI